MPSGTSSRGRATSRRAWRIACASGRPRRFREGAGYDDAVDKNSGAYQAGRAAGRSLLVGIADGGSGKRAGERQRQRVGFDGDRRGAKHDAARGMALCDGEKFDGGERAGRGGGRSAGRVSGLRRLRLVRKVIRQSRIILGSTFAGAAGGAGGGIRHEPDAAPCRSGSVRWGEVGKAALWGASAARSAGRVRRPRQSVRLAGQAGVLVQPGRGRRRQVRGSQCVVGRGRRARWRTRRYSCCRQAASTRGEC